MAYTLGQLVADVQSKLDDTSFDSTLIKQFINDAQREVAIKYNFPFFEASYSGSLVIDTYIYLIPSGIDTIEGMRITDPSGDEVDITRNYLDFRTFDQRFPDPSENESGVPRYWTVRDGNYYLFPKPDKTYTFDIRYQKIPTTLSADADVPEVPERFQEILVLGALSRAHKFNDEYDLADFEDRKMEELLFEASQRSSKRQTGTPSKMKSAWGR